MSRRLPMMLNYDAEAPRYDATRGGWPRARAAAAAIASLLPDGARVVIDIAGGTGTIGRALAQTGRTVLVADASAGMLMLAARRNPGRVLRGDATSLPLADACLDGASTLWLLHLLPGSAAVASVISEGARVLRPGGVFVTTVDKTSAHLHLEPDPLALDARARVEEVGRANGLDPCGSTTFVGLGQGRARVGDGSDPVFTLLALRRAGR